MCERKKQRNKKRGAHGERHMNKVKTAHAQQNSPVRGAVAEHDKAQAALR